MMSLSWNVYYSNVNSREIILYNIFQHSGFYADCVKAKKKHKEDKDAFAGEVKTSLMYYFWSKCEWEIILDHWPNGEIGDMRTTVKAGTLYDALRGSGVKYSPACIEYMRDKDVEIRAFPVWSKYNKRKIDVFDQVNNNWDVFIDYLWEHRRELRAKK